jgi:hypothetical protein
MNDWHGWSFSNSNLYIGELPGRKQVVLYTMVDDGSTIRPLAYFRSQEDARIALDCLDKLAAARG